MPNLSPRFLLSSRFLALPLFAVAVIVALAYAGRAERAGDQVAATKIYRAVNCANPAHATSTACTVAAGTVTRVR